MATDNKIEALADFLGGIDTNRIRRADDEWRSEAAKASLYLVDDRYEFFVANEKEANTLAAESIKEKLWAFEADFICEHSAALTKAGGRAENSVREMQRMLCEDAQPIIEALIDDLDTFIEDAIEADGRGHFIADYDGEEHDQGPVVGKYGLNIYCMDTDEVELEFNNEERDV